MSKSSAFITGWTDSENNSLVHEISGMFVSEDGNHWSNKPFNKEQAKIYKRDLRKRHTYDKVIEHLCRTKRTIRQEIELIQQNKSTLPKYCRDYLIKHPLTHE